MSGVGTFARLGRFICVVRLRRARVGRHNREGVGVDQRGFSYRVSYQPDWLRHVKITRALSSGRQSTMTLFRNPAERSAGKGAGRVRTRIECPEQGVDVEVAVLRTGDDVSRVAVTCVVPAVSGVGSEEVTFILEDGLPS
jgi:hypothetical protein